MLTVKQGNEVHLYIKDSLVSPYILHNINVFQSNSKDITDDHFMWYKDTFATYNLGFWDLQGSHFHNGYDVTIKNSGWVSLIVPGNGTVSFNTKLSVYLPVNFTNKNTLIYAVKNGSNNVARVNADYSSRTFSLSNIPYNQNLTLITISKIDHKYYLGVVNTNFSSHQNILNIVPQQVTIANIIDYLNSL